MQRIRNPSPPPNFTDFRSNMHIEFLKPMFSEQSIELSMDLFNKNLFISPPKTTPEITHETVASYDLENTPVPENLQLIPDTDIYEVRTEPLPETKESSKGKEPEKAHKKRSRKSSKKHKKEPISSDDQRRHHKRESSKHKKKYLPEKYALGSSSDDQRRHHKSESSKYKKKHVPVFTLDSDSDEISKTEKHHKRYSLYRNVSESDSADYYEKDSRKRSHKKTRKHKEYNSDSSNGSFSRSLRDYQRHKDIKIEHVTSDSDKSVGADRHHRRRVDYRKECIAIDSDKSRGSVEVDQHQRPSFKKEYVSLDSDGSDSKQECYNQTIKQEFAEDSGLSEAKYDPDIEYKEEYDETIHFGPDTFYCKICQLHLNGLTTYESHMNGKRHKKNEKAQQVPDLLKGSLSTLASTKESLRPTSTQSCQFVVIDAESVLERVLAGYTDNPLIGLDYVEERRSSKDTVYLCKLCDAPCMAVSVIPHLIGSKHQLKFLRVINERLYEDLKDRPKKYIGERIREALFRHQRKYGRGNITVVAVKESPKGEQPEAGPSWRNPDSMQPHTDIDISSARVHGPFPDFDATKNDYYCKICDAHMNNFQMFESHRRGKRHLKNEKKTASERHAQLMETRAPPGTRSELEKIISKNNEDVFVGLNYIRETHSENGPLYLCYICGSSGVDTVIIDHILTLKHRVKYLETVNENGMIPNAISEISELEVSSINRETLVLGECEKIEKKYGRGTVEIYISKSAEPRW